jgi:hypothetical protein
MSITSITRGIPMPLSRPEDLGTPEARAAWLDAIRARGSELAAAAAANPLSADELAEVAQLTEWSSEVRTLDADHAQAATAQAAALDALTAINAEPAPAAAADPAPGETPPVEAPTDPAPDGGAAVVAGAEAILVQAAESFATALASAASRIPAPGDMPGASGAPTVAQLLGNGAPSTEPEPPARPAMVAAADVGGGFTSGQNLEDRAQLAAAVRARLEGYGLKKNHVGPALKLPTTELAAAEVVRMGANVQLTGRSQRMHNPSRHGAARIFRDESAEQFEGDPQHNWNVANNASAQWAAQLAAGRTAAALGVVERPGLVAAWCAPSEAWYQLCNQTSLDGQLPLPERTVSRGGIILAEGGGYEFGAIYDMLGDNTATNEQLEAGVTKTCIEVPCLDTVDERLNADWLCITASLLQRRAWPESIEALIAMALAAKAHKTNSRIIASIVAASTAVEPNVCTGQDAFSTLLQAIGIATVDLATRAYMSLGGEFEVVLPVWIREQLRTALINRRAVDDPVKADAWLQSQFAKLGVTVHFVYGWQDAHITPAPAGFPGAATPIENLPDEVQFLIYPAGTWIKGVNPVIDLDTIYDSTNLATNSYTALFVEDGWLALQTCPYSRVYTVPVNPCGCGCDGTTTSP